MNIKALALGSVLALGSIFGTVGAAEARPSDCWSRNFTPAAAVAGALHMHYHYDGAGLNKEWHPLPFRSALHGVAMLKCQLGGRLRLWSLRMLPRVREIAAASNCSPLRHGHPLLLLHVALRFPGRRAGLVVLWS